MKTKGNIRKWWMLAFIIVMILAAGILVFIWRPNKQREIVMPGQFALIDNRPTMIKDGKVYEYGTDGVWKDLGLAGEAKQIVKGEALFVLNTDGSLYYGEELESEEVMPLDFCLLFTYDKNGIRVR